LGPDEHRFDKCRQIGWIGHPGGPELSQRAVSVKVRAAVERGEVMDARY
jgi:hypothetical protein